MPCCLFVQGNYYELYELDAEIGNKELGWKITLSGEGKCRQVGLSLLSSFFPFLRLRYKLVLK